MSGLTLCYQADSMAEELSELKNKVTELEDEKGNLQLRLVDYDEAKSQIGMCELLLLFWHQGKKARSAGA